jgi:hypothetical protein
MASGLNCRVIAKNCSLCRSFGGDYSLATGSIRPIAASEIEDFRHARRLLERSTKEITMKAYYRRVGEI